MPGARHDVFRAAESHYSTDDLRQGSGHGRENHSRHQGTGSFLRRHSTDDRERHVCHQRYRARYRQPVAPFAGRVLRKRQQQVLLPREDHSVPRIVDRKLTHEIRNPKSDEVIVGAHKRINENLFKEMIKARITQVRAALADLEGAYSVADVVNRQTGEVLLEANKPLTAELWQAFAEGGIAEVDVLFPERDDIGVVLSRTLDKDAIRSSKEALIEIYRKLRPGDPPTLETATNLFRGMFFDPRKYDFSRVGRLKFNIKMGLDTPLD